jgi:HK97 family phage portal protein
VGAYHLHSVPNVLTRVASDLWDDVARRTWRRQERRVEKRDGGISDLINPDEWVLSAILGRVASATGIVATPLRMMGVATCYACVRVRSTILASLPCKLYKRTGDASKVIAYEHPLYTLLTNAPNEEMTAYDFIQVMEGHHSLRQNAFCEIMRDGDGDINGLYPIDPMDIMVCRNPKTLKLHYKFMRQGVDFPLEDIMHIRGYNRVGVMGIDLSVSLQEVFALAIALQDNAAKFFGNGSRPSGVLEHPNVLGAEAGERLKTQVEQSMSGRNTYRMLLLEEGLKYAQVRSENKDSQFQEAREYQDLQICRVFGVPPHKVAILQGSPRANIEQENISFYQDTIRPLCVNWEAQMNMKLLSDEERGQGYHFAFDMDAMLRADMVSRFNAYQIGINIGAFSVDEVRQREGMNPIGPERGGTVHWRQMQNVPLNSPIQPQVMPQATPAQPGKPGKDGKPTPGTPAQPAPELAPETIDPASDVQPIEPPARIVLKPKPRELAVAEDPVIQRTS